MVASDYVYFYLSVQQVWEEELVSAICLQFELSLDIVNILIVTLFIDIVDVNFD